MTTEFVGNQGTSKLFDENGKFIRARSGTCKLSRSGGTRVFTFYLGASPQGASMLYRVDGDQFVTVDGMLTNSLGDDEAVMRVWKRVTGNAEKVE